MQDLWLLVNADFRAVGDCRFAKEHEGQYDWVCKNEGHKGVQVTSLSGFGDYVVQALGTCRTGSASVRD